MKNPSNKHLKPLMLLTLLVLYTHPLNNTNTLYTTNNVVRERGRFLDREGGESGAMRLHPFAYINAPSFTAHRLTLRAFARSVLNFAREGRLSTYQATAYLARSFNHLRDVVCRQCASWGTC